MPIYTYKLVRKRTFYYVHAVRSIQVTKVEAWSLMEGGLVAGKFFFFNRDDAELLSLPTLERV